MFFRHLFVKVRRSLGRNDPVDQPIESAAGDCEIPPLVVLNHQVPFRYSSMAPHPLSQSHRVAAWR